MSKEFLSNRRKRLEETFFHKQNAKLQEQLRVQALESADMNALSAASGINDEAVLQRLFALGIRCDTLAALCLIPLIEIAWADHDLNRKERDAILSGAEQAGLKKNTPSHELLESWLEEKPGPDLLLTWKEYVGELSAALSGDEKNSLKHDLLARARNVSDAAGGFLGFGNRVSEAEDAMLTELEQAFL